MLKQLAHIVVPYMLITSPIVFAESMEEAEQKCTQWAQEEQVESQEMEAYMKDCVKSLTEESDQDNK